MGAFRYMLLERERERKRRERKRDRKREREREIHRGKGYREKGTKQGEMRIRRRYV